MTREKPRQPVNSKAKFIALGILLLVVMSLAGETNPQQTVNTLPDSGGKNPFDSKEPDKTSAIEYKHLSMNINGLQQKIDILEVDVGKPGVKVMPVLSNDIIYGFEYLSSMTSRKKAYAAVNSGFFTQYGLPSGMVAIDGQLVKASSGRHPVFTLSEGKAAISDFKSHLWLEYPGGRFKIDGLNSEVPKGKTAVYTPIYGSDSRIAADNYTVSVRAGKVVKAEFYKGAVEIPKDGMLVCLHLGDKSNDVLPFNIGEAIKLIHEPALPTDVQAYECGSRLIKEGKVVIGDRDELVGVLTNRDPRTAIGIKRDGKVLLVTVDGRQPGFSAGMTGRELADLMLELGAADAAMLDGGASTEMIVDGKIVNGPSFKGLERPLGGGILVFK